MRPFLCALLLTTLAAQDSKVTSTRRGYDLNGRPIAGPDVLETSAGGTREVTATQINLNGRRVPVEKVEERVVSDNGTTKVVERLVRRFDPSGTPAQPERTVIEQTKRSDGATTTVSTTYRRDVSGNQVLGERSRTDVVKNGATTTTTTVLEQPAPTGGLQPARRIESVVRDLGNGASTETVVVTRPDANGSLRELERATTDRKTVNGQVEENTALYTTYLDGNLRLEQQTVARTQKAADGSELKVVDVFAVGGAAGSAGTGGTGGGVRLREQQVLQSKPISGGVATSLSVRKADPNYPGRLGQPQVVNETTCTGKCK